MENITKITTTADLFGHAEKVNHLQKLSSAIKTDYVILNTKSGSDMYKLKDDNWQPCIKMEGIESLN